MTGDEQTPEKKGRETTTVRQTVRKDLRLCERAEGKNSNLENRR